MAILRYENLTHVELASLSRDKTVVFISAGPLEQHGPHLPLGTDAITADFFAEQAAKRLSELRPDWNFVLFPPLYAGSDTLTYTGTIEVRPTVLRAILMDNCRQLSMAGFRNIVLFGTHGGPRHMVVLEEVATKMRWRHRARVVSASAQVLYDILQGGFTEKITAHMDKAGLSLTSEQREGLKKDYHGGLLETSVMLHARPELVNPIYKTLKPALVDSYWKLRRTSGKTVGAGLGHLGSPALANPEIGKAAVDVFLADTVPLLSRFLDGENVNKAFRSRFYFIPFFRTDFFLLMIVLMYPVLIYIAWLFIKSFFFGGLVFK